MGSRTLQHETSAERCDHVMCTDSTDRPLGSTDQPMGPWGRVMRWPSAAVIGILVWLVRGYQTLISPALTPRCRFHPSCSAYTIGALRRHGLLKGSLLATWRLLRCNPFGKGGYDPP
jgi:putative membrane protein insertion efficiency factor